MKITSLFTIPVLICLTACGDKGKPSGGGSESTGSGGKDSAEGAAVVSCTLNGAEWKGTVNKYAANFYPKGLEKISTTPFLTFTFTASDPADKRQMIVNAKSVEPKAGVLDYKNTEVTFLGAAKEGGKTDNVSNHVDGQFDKELAPFTIEITEWKSTGADSAVLSGKFSGTLVSSKMGPGFEDLRGPEYKIENGTFSMKVSVSP